VRRSRNSFPISEFAGKKVLNVVGGVRILNAVSAGGENRYMPDGPYRVTIVCSGNTCRSPMAAGILTEALAERGAEGIEVASAGTLGIVGSPATPLAVEVSRSFGVDIAAHRSQAFTEDLARSSDLVLALSAEHFGAALALGAPAENVYMLKTFPRRTKDLVGASIHDPIGGDREEYLRVFLEIDDALRQGVSEIIRQAAAGRGEREGE